MDGGKQGIECSGLHSQWGRQTKGVGRHSQLNVFRFTYILQPEAPLPQLSFVGFLRARCKFLCKVLVGCIDEGLSELVSVVHLLYRIQAEPLTVVFFEGGVKNAGVLKHELLGDGTTTWFCVGLLVHVLESLDPDTALVAGVVDVSSVAKPRGDLLRE